MTGGAPDPAESSTFKYNAVPAELAVRCGGCGACAQFQFAAIALIKTVADREYFKADRAFECVKITADNGQMRAVAIYYFGLGQRLPDADELPVGYTPDLWRARAPAGHRIDKASGSLACFHCHVRKKHTLSWPSDAYFQITYKSQMLWAYDRGSAVKLRDYLASDARVKTQIKVRERGGRTETHRVTDSFLSRIPEVFQTQTARKPVVKKLTEIIEAA